MASPADIIQVLMVAIVMVLSILGNTAIFYVILRVRRLHCPTGFLLVNLTVIDILMAGILLPLRMSGILSESRGYGDISCAVIGFIQNVLSYACVLTVLAVSFDRYLAIVLPLRYKSRVTSTRTTIAVLCIWGYSVLCGCYPLIGWGQYSYIPGLWLCDTDYITEKGFLIFKLSSMYFIPLIIITCLYYKIFRVSKRHSKQIRREVEAMNFRETSVDVETQVGKINDVSGQFCLRKPHSRLRSELKTALTLGFVAGALFLSWAPSVILTIWTSSISEMSSILAIEIASFFYYLSIMINPYIYGYLNRTIKSQLKNYINDVIERCSELRVKSNKVTPSIIVIAPGEETRQGSIPTCSGIS